MAALTDKFGNPTNYAGDRICRWCGHWRSYHDRNGCGTVDDHHQDGCKCTKKHTEL